MNTINLMFGVAVVLGMQGCEQATTPTEPRPVAVTDTEFQQFVASIKNNLIFVEGGEFLMGDFGPEYAPERSSYDWDKDSKPLHKVELTSYSINRFKVTNIEFQFYLRYNGMKLKEKGAVIKSEWDNINSVPNTPAHIDWYEAEQYCSWLGSVTDLPFALPTEAQWEYAARSRGQFLMVATDNGTYKAEPYSLVTESYDPKGINISSRGNRVTFAKEMGWKTGSFTPLPVDMFPPNPLGIYSMTDNGYEWVKDWYDPDYYKISPMKDPQGPSNPVFKDTFGNYTKVMRGQSYADPHWGGGFNVHRTEKDPMGRFGERGTIALGSSTMRCVVNNPEPVTHPRSINKPDAAPSELKDRQ
ncbi:SUMF1/EgtB/PvdO family nonheme iron enzyme [Pseudomonas sp. G.S.17]|uniref:formylglycine-generating enzyme family protein n=1 Tax=Pseudomonas sp. G.S.17 TaxID=3137451 RepID=UPI00311CD4A9